MFQMLCTSQLAADLLIFSLHLVVRGLQKTYSPGTSCCCPQVSNGAFKAFWDMKGWVEEQQEPQTQDGVVMKL